MTPTDALRAEQLDATTARELLERTAIASPEAWRELARDDGIAPVARRLAIRRLFEVEVPEGTSLADAGARIAANAWLHAPDIRPVSVVNGKLPVRWLAEDLIVAIDVCPARPGAGDHHRLVVYLRIAGQPDPDEVLSGLRGGTGGGHEIREVGYSEPEAARKAEAATAAPRPPYVSALVMCRRAICDQSNGMHSLIDVIVQLPARLPGPALFDIYLQLRRVTGPIEIAIEVLDGDGGVLTTGELALGAGGEPGPSPPALGVAIPNVAVGFERAGVHLLRVRAGDTVLAEQPFDVVDVGDVSPP